MAPVKSLTELATTVCIKNIKALESVGDYLPYESVRHILSKVENAFQLRQIELNSPQLQGEIGELWIKLIEKDFPLEYRANAYKPQTPDKWHRVWEKYKKEHDTALEESENKLKNALAGLQEDKQKKTSKIVERKYLPRAGRVGPKRLLGSRDGSLSTLSFNAGSRTRTHNGASVMRKVRREVMEIATIHGALSKPIRAPTLHAGVSKAPAAMVSEHQRAARPQYRVAAEPLSAIAQYEKRATFISDSEEDDDVVFAEAAPRKPASKPASTPVKKPVSDAAKVSLLKQRPTALRAAPSTKPGTPAKPPAVTTPQKQEASPGNAPCTPVPCATTKKAATQASNLKKSPTKPQTAAKASSSKAPPESSTSTPPSKADSSCLSATKTTSPRNDSAGPSSPEEVVAASATAPPPLPRKRKPVDIFMRPRKR